MSTSPPRSSDSRSTDSITVCSTPSTRRHTLIVRTPFPVLIVSDCGKPETLDRTACAPNDHEMAPTGTSVAPEFCSMWGLDLQTQPLNHIKFRVGHNRRAWVKELRQYRSVVLLPRAS